MSLRARRGNPPVLADSCVVIPAKAGIQILQPRNLARAQAGTRTTQRDLAALGRNQNLFSRQDAKSAKKTSLKCP